jgi:short-subunit dehydrogenase
MVRQLLEQQSYVVASARNAENHPELLKLKESYTDHLTLLDCDVTQTQNLPTLCDQAWSFFGGLDSWVYNVGTYHPMRLAEWDLAQFDLMTQTNYSGAVHLMHALLPKFKQALIEQPQYHSPKTPAEIQKNQWLLNVSLASDFGLPYGGGYSAPKAALMNLAESLQPELAEAGIHLKVVNHGFVKTRLTAKNDFAMLGLMEPKDAAKKIIQSLKEKRFESRFPFSLALVLGTIKRLPKSWAMAITKRMLTDV